MTSFSAIILAAGKGTRMNSSLPKPLHKIAGKPMLQYVIEAYQAAGAQEIVIVIAADDKLTPALFPNVKTVIQTEVKGTGQATLVGLRGLTTPVDKIISALGDVPFVTAETIKALAEDKNDVTVLAMRAEDPLRYGRLVQKADGRLDKIVEFKDATDAEKEIKLCNSGIIALNGKLAEELLTAIKTNNAAGEYYLTDVVAIANERGLHCGVIEACVFDTAGINSREELAVQESRVQQKLRQQAMINGATLLDPLSVYFSHDTKIGKDVIIEPHVFFGPGVTVDDGVRIKAFSHIEGAHIKANAEIGPYARLRPDSVIGEDAKIGNFVEIKKAHIATGAKINHLSYIGDASIGAKTNVGAGTVVCNYDGFDKYKSIIGENVFIGSNSTLVSPVTIGDGAMTAAGSVITKDIAPDALAIARGTQTEKDGWAASFRDKKKKDKKEN